MSLSWWPYPISPKEAFKRGTYIVSGIVIGTFVINHFFQPMQDLTKDYENGKTRLLETYSRIFEDHKIQQLLEASSIYSHENYMKNKRSK